MIIYNIVLLRAHRSDIYLVEIVYCNISYYNIVIDCSFGL